MIHRYIILKKGGSESSAHFERKTMGLLQKGNDRNSGKAVYSRQNRKADQKLDMLTDMFCAAAGDKHIATERKLLQKRSSFEGFRYMKYLDQRYNFENRLFTVIYNHELGTEILTDDRFEECGSCSFEIKNHGKLRIKDTEWVCTGFDGNDVKKSEYLKRLNNPLITDRIKDLELIKLKISHEAGSGKWLILMESIIGSSTWLLLPPSTNMIKPSALECIRFLELIELIADAAVNNKK